MPRVTKGLLATLIRPLGTGDFPSGNLPHSFAGCRTLVKLSQSYGLYRLPEAVLLGPSCSPRYTFDLRASRFGSKAGIRLNLPRRCNPHIRWYAVDSYSYSWHAMDQGNLQQSLNPGYWYAAISFEIDGTSKSNIKDSCNVPPPRNAAAPLPVGFFARSVEFSKEEIWELKWHAKVSPQTHSSL